MERKCWKFIAESSEQGQRLDQLVSDRTGLSRRKTREILQLGGVQVDRKRVKVASRIVKSGQEIRVALDASLGQLPDMVVDVVFEDTWLLAVNKPTGLPTQGTQASDRHDLMALLKRQRPELDLRLVHRLDQGTSGLLLMAKDAATAARLGKLWQGREIRKSYLARISKPVEACEIQKPIGRLRLAVPARYACEGDLLDPKPSLTFLRPATPEEIQDLEGGAWVVAEPHTGRTHQIRVHLASMGAPVVGDSLYGGPTSSQMWLHAWKLELIHPATGEGLLLIAEPTRFRRPLSIEGIL